MEGREGEKENRNWYIERVREEKEEENSTGETKVDEREVK